MLAVHNIYILLQHEISHHEGVIGLVITPQKRVKMIDVIRSNILDKTHIKDKELAKQIARDWIKKAGGMK